MIYYIWIIIGPQLFEIVQFTIFEGGTSLLTALINPYKYVSEFSKDKNLIQGKNFIVPIN